MESSYVELWKLYIIKSCKSNTLFQCTGLLFFSKWWRNFENVTLMLHEHVLSDLWVLIVPNKHDDVNIELISCIINTIKLIYKLQEFSILWAPNESYTFVCLLLKLSTCSHCANNMHTHINTHTYIMNTKEWMNINEVILQYLDTSYGQII